MLIFLDFDGVLHARTGAEPFQETCLTALASALGPYDARIVITSTWREHAPLDTLRQKLIPLNKQVVGLTPVIDDPFLPHVRYHEVIAYLDQEHLRSEPWLAIDDMPGFYPETAPIYWTNPSTGFTSNDIRALQQFIGEISRQAQNPRGELK